MDLPEGCIAAILCRTTPVDAARLSVVSKTFCSAADSDGVWDRFLPSDYRLIVSQSPSLADAPSKKALYLALSDHPIIIDQGKKSVQLDRKSGNKCYMLAARSLSIVWGDDDRYWRWISLPESRFPEVASLENVCWLEIRGLMNTMALSPNTQYVAFLVFNMIDVAFSFGFHCPVELSVRIIGGHSSTKNVCLDPKLDGMQYNGAERLQCPTVRRDGWLEIEMGEFFNSGLEDEELQMSVLEINDGNWKSGLHLEGIEVRPKHGEQNFIIEGSRKNIWKNLQDLWGGLTKNIYKNT